MENLDGTTKRLVSDPADHRFEFDKRSQLFIDVHNNTLSVVAMCVCTLAFMSSTFNGPPGRGLLAFL